MIAGPIFSREVITAPRRVRLFAARAAYAFGLLLIALTAWLLTSASQEAANLGELARFGEALFQLFAPLQLVLALFLSAMQSAGAVAHEKDRRTMSLLLLTNLANHELVLGKLFAGLLLVFTSLLAGLPVLLLLVLLGGISFEQVLRVEAVTLATIVAAGCVGTTLALWREHTLQTLWSVLLVLVLWIGLGEAVAHGVFGHTIGPASSTRWAASISPWRAVLDAARPGGATALAFTTMAAGLSAALVCLATLGVRAWNCSRDFRAATESVDESSPAADRGAASDAERRSAHAAPGKTRQVWDNPILWREIRTWAYGRRVLLVRAAYAILAAISAWQLVAAATGTGQFDRVVAALSIGPLFLLSLLLINAQAVISVATERDLKAIDLLLVTDLTAREFIFGKILGVLYNVKEMVLLPALLCLYIWWTGKLSAENLAYLLGSLAVMVAFVTMLGIHSGLTYETSRSAVAVSLGTVFFLFVGVATCMRLMVAFAGSFEVQLQPFLAFMVGGFVGLYMALGGRNPSPAIGMAALVCPFATFYAITIYWLEYTLGVFLVIGGAYGFATAAMLVPAVFEFDAAVGRTGAGE